MDSQQVELVGRAALETRLIRLGFEIAHPQRDKGVDLIVFLDEPAKPFAALPIQMKASSGTAFGVWRKYEKMTGLVLVYIWYASTSPRFFLMSYKEAAALIPARQKRTKSWNKPPRQKPGWSWPKTPRQIATKLDSYENRWDWLTDRLKLSRIIAAPK